MQPTTSGPFAPPSGTPKRKSVQTYLYAATSLWAMSVGLLIAPLPFRFEQLGIPVVQYGLALAAYAAGMLVTESLWGVVAFRMGRPAIIVGVGSVVAAATLFLAISTTFVEFLIAEALLGAVGVYLAPVLRWVGLTYLGKGSEGAGTGRWSAVFGLGLAIGVSLGPIVFVAAGFAVVAVVSVVVLALGVGAAAGLPWRLASLPPVVSSRPRGLRALFDRSYLFAVVLVLITYTAMTFTTNFYQYYSTLLFGGTPAEAGLVLGASRGVALGASLLLGTYVDRWGSVRSTPAGFVLLFVGGLGTWASQSYGELVLATLVFSAGIGWLSAGLLPLALRSVPSTHQGTAIGVFGTVEDAGLLIGPLVFGGVWSVFGPPEIFPVVTSLAAAGLLVSWLVPLRRPARAPLPGISVDRRSRPD